MTHILTAEQQRKERLRAMATTFQRADTTLAGFPIKVVLGNSRNIKSPGYSLNNEITLNMPYIGSVDSTNDLVKITGLNFHEFSHCMLTPDATRDGNVQRMQDDGYHGAFNALEDQRIETMISAKYRSLRPYFTTMIMEYVAGIDETYWDTVHCLTYGRRYLPKKIREQFRLRYNKPGTLKELEKVIDQYRKIVYPRDGVKAYDLVKRYDELTKDANLPDLPHGHSDESRPAGGGGAFSIEQKVEEQQSGAEAAAKEDKKGWGQDSDKAEGNEESGSGDGESDGESEDAGSGVGIGGDFKEPNRDLRDQIEDALREVNADPSVRADISRVEREMAAHSGQIPDLKAKTYQSRKVPAEYLRASKQMSKELQKLWVEADPGWHTHKSSGRVNVQRAMRGGELDTLWDQWDEGVLDATEIEAVLLVDYSGSMSRQMNDTSRALWAIKHAIESVGGEVTVVGFSDGAVTFYNKNEKAVRTTYRAFGDGGGTSITAAIDQARLIFHYSKKSHRILFILTDGGWGDSRYGNESVDVLNSHGVMTALAYLDTSYYGDDSSESGVPVYHQHNCKYHQKISQPIDLVTLAKKIVTDSMKGGV